MSPQEDVSPRGVDTASASIARVYDAVIGGKDNFDVDRQVARDALAVHPSMPDLVVSGRRWLIRVVGYLADRCGMEQFLDLGSGLPTVQNTHEVAQRYQPEAHVVYVDNDPAVNAFERAMLSTSGGTEFSNADLTQPSEVLTDPAGTSGWTGPTRWCCCNASRCPTCPMTRTRGASCGATSTRCRAGRMWR